MRFILALIFLSFTIKASALDSIDKLPDKHIISIKNHNIQVTYVTKRKLWELYTALDPYWKNKSNVKVFLLPYSSDIMYRFITEKLGRTVYSFKKQVKRTRYLGKRRPPTFLTSEFVMLRKVSQTPNSIGILSKGVLVNEQDKVSYFIVDDTI
jgi:hypothetical protein